MDELLSRQMPHSDAAEQAVIGSLLIDPRLVPEVVAKGVRPEDFFREANRKVFELMFNMQAFARVIDPVTLVAEMREKGGFTEEAATNYIMDMMNITPTAANIQEYVTILKDMALLRGIAETGSAVSQLAMEGTEKAETVLEAAPHLPAAPGPQHRGLKAHLRGADGYHVRPERAFQKRGAYPWPVHRHSGAGRPPGRLQ